MKYTDAEIDAVALAIVNHRIARMMLPALTSLEGLSCDDIRAEARAALAAREALAEREADELRRLAWEWCIEARSGREALEPHERHYSKLYREKLRIEEENDGLRAQPQRLTDDAYEVDHRGNFPEPRSTFDVMADKAGPLATAVLADSPDEPPTESLGPVPSIAGCARRTQEKIYDPYPLTMQLDALEERVEWLVRDAVRRGAKLEDK